MAVLQTYTNTTMKDDLSKVITNITPDKTPFISTIKNNKAINTYHEWQTDSLSTPTDNSNAHVEGADFSEDTMTMPSRSGGYSQIFKKQIKVSGTMKAVQTIGMKDAYTYQVTKKSKELALGIEYAAINGTGASGASGTAREMKGALAHITTTVASASASGTSLTETIFNDWLEDIWDQGGDVDRIFCTGTLKRTISGFTADSVKSVDAKDKRLIAAVDVYEGDFGMHKIMAHRLLPAGYMMALQMDLWAIAWLRNTKHEALAKSGDSVRGQIVAEAALEALQEAGNGKAFNYA